MAGLNNFKPDIITVNNMPRVNVANMSFVGFVAQSNERYD